MRAITNDSHTNVENVVYTPRKPTVIAVDTSSDQRRSVATVTITARMNEPVTLIPSVAHGNRWVPTASPMR